MQRVKLATGIVQVVVAATATAIATGLIPGNAEFLALIVGLQNAFGAVDRTRDAMPSNGSPS